MIELYVTWYYCNLTIFFVDFLCSKLVKLRWLRWTDLTIFFFLWKFSKVDVKLFVCTIWQIFLALYALLHLLPRFSSVKIVFLLCNSVRMIANSGFWISSWVQGSFHQKSLSACYSIFIMILIVLNHHKILWISRHSLPLFLTIQNHWNNQNGGNSSKMSHLKKKTS